MIFFSLPSCVPATGNIESTVPEEVVTVLATRIPTSVPISLVSITPTHFPQPQSRPHYLVKVDPLENSEMTLNEYNIKEDIMDLSQAVCVDVNLRYIVQTGDDLSVENMSDRINLEVDGVERLLVRVLEESTLNWTEIEGTRTYFSGLNMYCWQAELEEGSHHAEFRVRQTDGNLLSYSWYFTLTPDE
jgi:hypothetical protein